ncbi:hypothetical protein F4811DRAFT_550923 [Daldinia bambusicola]|nr:hypothetical protein F4811DRAFT_550923 [Daldinia bambusicola]
MCPISQILPVPSEEQPRRGPDDVIFKYPVSQHTYNVKYRWTRQQSRIFWQHVQRFPDNYAENIGVLLRKLELDGYEGIETENGTKFKKEVLMPKVLSKLGGVARNHGKYEKYKLNEDENAPSDQTPNLPAQAEDHHPPMHASNHPQGHAETYHTQYGAAKLDTNVYPRTTVIPQNTHPLGFQIGTLGLENASRNMHNNRESATPTIPAELVDQLADFFENHRNQKANKAFAQQGYPHRYPSVSDDNTEPSDYDDY